MIDLEGIQANADSSSTFCFANSPLRERVSTGEGGGGGGIGGVVVTTR